MHDVCVATLLARFTFRLSERVRRPLPSANTGHPTRRECFIGCNWESQCQKVGEKRLWLRSWVALDVVARKCELDSLIRMCVRFRAVGRLT